MSFPRSFKKQVWYMRLPSGEVEIVTAAELERAFHCGLVEARTPVRAFGAHTWTTMLEAAELPVPAGTSMASLSPIAFDAPAADLGDGAPWLSRTDVDPRAFKPSKAPAVLAIFVSAAFVAAAVLGSKLPRSPALERVAAASSLTSMPAVRVSRPDVREMMRTPKSEEERLTSDQKRRLREIDYTTRMHGRKVHSLTPLLGTRPSEDPFSRRAKPGAHSGDPLDGSF